MKKFTLALIAHDGEKDNMVHLVKAHKGELSLLRLVATRNTGQLVMENTNLPVALMQSGPLGGDQQIGAMVANEDVDAVIFLRDPLTAHPHEPDVSALLRICDAHGVPLATNLVTAEAVLHLFVEHPEALRGHRLGAECLDEIAAVHS
ncbi:MAG: methylglyoxal synthase [Chloroflexi bacterium RBG_13_57_8]|nr:MAG: methylglyoxal synthase [Chloroflexi bacterium RBG_13_57_8]